MSTHGERMRAGRVPPFAIIGAGVAGLTLAILLRRRGHAVRVFEARGRAELADGAFLTLAPNGINALKAAGLPRGERLLRAQGALESVGLLALADHPARVLSGGEQQRLALARAWALRPEVLFLDEPTANLDPSATREVEAIIAAIHAVGTKIVMTTHNLGQARRLGDEVLFCTRVVSWSVLRSRHFSSNPRPRRRTHS